MLNQSINEIQMTKAADAKLLDIFVENNGIKILLPYTVLFPPVQLMWASSAHVPNQHIAYPTLALLMCHLETTHSDTEYINHAQNDTSYGNKVKVKALISSYQ